MHNLLRHLLTIWTLLLRNTVPDAHIINLWAVPLKSYSWLLLSPLKGNINSQGIWMLKFSSSSQIIHLLSKYLQRAYYVPHIKKKSLHIHLGWRNMNLNILKVDLTCLLAARLACICSYSSCAFWFDVFFLFFFGIVMELCKINENKSQVLKII